MVFIWNPDPRFKDKTVNPPPVCRVRLVATSIRLSNLLRQGKACHTMEGADTNLHEWVVIKMFR